MSLVRPGRKMLAAAGAAASLLAALASSSAAADPVADFYAGRTLTMIAATGAGGGYDFYGRLVGKYLVRHLPGTPKFVMQFMPGAGGNTAANHVYAAAPKDGSVVSLLSNAAPLFQVIGAGSGVRYDASKFSYIGRAASMQYVIMASAASGIKSLDDMKTKELVFGSTGKAQSSYMVPVVLKSVFGLKARVIIGYPSTSEISLALERGEVHGRAAAWSSWITQRPDWINDKTVAPLAQSGLERVSDLPHIPLLSEIATTPEDKAVLELLASDAAVGRGFNLPPGVPAERVTAMRRAFDKAMADPEFLAEAKQRRLIVEPWTGERLQGVVDKVIATPPELVKRAKEVLG